MTQTKVDVTREAVERLAQQASAYAGVCAQTGDDDGLVFMSDAAATLRALLDAKEAAERERNDWERCYKAAGGLVLAERAQLSEARAANAAMWEDGYDNGVCDERTGSSMCSRPNTDATEALRAVKEAVWEEGFNAGWSNAGSCDDNAPNPYAKKDTA